MSDHFGEIVKTILFRLDGAFKANLIWCCDN